MQKAALYTAGVIFAAGAVVHIFRLITSFEITAGPVVMPVWVSYLGVLIAALLAVWMVLAAQLS